MNKNAILYKDTFAAAGSPLAIAIADSDASNRRICPMYIAMKEVKPNE